MPVRQTNYIVMGDKRNRPRLTVDFLLVTFHALQFAECTDIEQVYLAVTSCRSDQITVRTPVARIDCRFVRVSAGSARLSTASIPLELDLQCTEFLP